MQTLYVKTKDEDGKEIHKEVHVLFAWGDIRTGTLFLHENGIYGYKDGAPVKNERELTDAIADPIQRKYAQLWWKNVGAKLSEEYYRTQAEQAEKRFAGAIGKQMDVAQMDMVQYRRRPVNNRAETAYSDAMSWSSMGFETRPDWWGHARSCEIGDWYFRRCDPEEAQKKAA
jgi:hypothetical protein